MTGKRPDYRQFTKVSMKKNAETIDRFLFLSVVSKVFEKLVYVQTNNYLKENNILTKHQSGFREEYSTGFSLLNITNSWLIYMDSELVNGVLFLDLKKTFDTVDHKLMVRKLNLHKIKGVVFSWITSYLSNRTQVCKINNTMSSSSPVSCGVPQGSNLGLYFSSCFTQMIYQIV